jgi:YD repeat-containing protein
VFALVFAAPALASQAAPQPKDPAPIMGDLVKVDTDKKVVTVKVADGTETEFQYNDSTEISGATKDAAGLATMKEGRVTVHFKEDAQTRSKLATRIIVQPKK